MYYSISPRAVADLDEIWDYIAQESGNPAAATRVVRQITRVFPEIGKYPYIGRSREADLGPERRSFVVSTYIVVYTIKATEVEILRVLHTSRDVQAILEDE
jgi:toxin ParE1/3/4